MEIRLEIEEYGIAGDGDERVFTLGHGDVVDGNHSVHDCVEERWDTERGLCVVEVERNFLASVFHCSD